MARGILLYCGYDYMNDIDLDSQIYKFFSLKNILNSLDEGYLYFQNVTKWEDVWEQPFRFYNYKDQNEFISYEFMKNDKVKIFGSCFTEEYNTDAMWRIYSQNRFGVCIQTTPRKLLEALSIYQFHVGGFLARVLYFNESSFAQDILSEKVCLKYPHLLYPVYIKRDSFSHEKEIRFVFCERYNERFKECVCGEGVKLNFDFRAIIDKIILDPRLSKNELDFLTRGFEKYKLAITQSELYKIPEFSAVETFNQLLHVEKWSQSGSYTTRFITSSQDEIK